MTADVSSSTVGKWKALVDMWRDAVAWGYDATKTLEQRRYYKEKATELHDEMQAFRREHGWLAEDK